MYKELEEMRDEAVGAYFRALPRSLGDNTEQSTGNQEINGDRLRLEINTYRRQVGKLLG
jgi:hypothetical protein